MTRMLCKSWTSYTNCQLQRLAPLPAGHGRQGALAVLRQQLVPDLAVAVPLPGEH